MRSIRESSTRLEGQICSIGDHKCKNYYNGEQRIFSLDMIASDSDFMSLPLLDHLDGGGEGEEVQIFLHMSKSYLLIKSGRDALNYSFCVNNFCVTILGTP